MVVSKGLAVLVDGTKSGLSEGRAGEVKKKKLGLEIGEFKNPSIGVW